MKWLAWVASLGLAAAIAVAAGGWRSRGISTQLQPIDHALVSANGREVTVPALGGGCIRRVVLTATGTRQVVRLRLTAYSLSGPHVACPADVALLQASTTLRAPLGRRQLVDASTGHRISFIPETELARPRWLPRGASGPDSSPMEGWTRTYTFPDRVHRAPLTIVENPRDFANPGELGAQAGTVSHLTIHGHPATLVAERQQGTLLQDRIGWHAGGYAITVESQSLHANQRPFSPLAIRHVAAELHVPSER